MSGLRFKFGGLVALALCWALLMVTLIERVPPAVREPSTSPAPPDPGTTTEGPRGEAARVLIASDGACLGGLVSALNSVLIHTRRPVQFFIVTPAEERRHLRHWIEATALHRMRYELQSLNASLPLVKAHLLPGLRGGRLIYLDCDVIVRGDIWELFTADIRPGHVGAFPANCITNTTTCALSTGAFVANLTQWRTNGVAGRVLQLVQGRRDVESALGATLAGRVTRLDPLWHVADLGSRSKQFVERRAKLLHWAGRPKPWGPRGAPHAEVWQRYYVPDPSRQFRPARSRRA